MEATRFLGMKKRFAYASIPPLGTKPFILTLNTPYGWELHVWLK